METGIHIPILSVREAVNLSRQPTAITGPTEGFHQVQPTQPVKYRSRKLELTWQPTWDQDIPIHILLKKCS